MEMTVISAEDRKHLRELARKQLEYASLPVMRERERLWYKHNDLKGDRPMITFETWTFEEEVLPPLRCSSPAAREIERQLNRNFLNHELIDDDRVVPASFEIEWDTHIRLFDLDIPKAHARDSQGRDIGYQTDYPIRDVCSDLERIRPTVHTVDREATLRRKVWLEEIFGDILPVTFGGKSLEFSVTMHALDLMGMEAMMFAMVDTPDEFHEFMKRIAAELTGTLRWMEQEGLLTPNYGNHLLHQGSWGFTTDLPGKDYRLGSPLTLQNLWGYMDAEIIGFSPDMFGEFLFPHYQEAAGLFGLLSYGCCEPLHLYWEKYISRLKDLRKVSVASWTDEAYMGEVLRGTGIIYHRKPSANFIGVGREFDEDGFRASITKTLECAQGCRLEFSFRDVYTLGGDCGKPRRAVKLVRELVEEFWQI